MSPPSFPRTLLLTWRAPDGRYATNEVLRKIAGRFPAGTLQWASMTAPRPEAAALCPHRAFAPRHLHWRLEWTALNYFYVHNVQAPAIARRVAAWAAPFRPEVIWVLAELGATNVAHCLRRLLGVPIHATVHDAYECARFIDPPRYHPIYLHCTRRMFRRAKSVDAVSDELLAHIRDRYGERDLDGIAFPPSIARDQMAGAAPAVDPNGTPAVRRIGICGSTRTSAWQWESFVRLLARLPYAFEIVTFVYEDLFPKVDLPANVRRVAHPYAPTERDLIRSFREGGIWAAYVGLWKDDVARPFARFSMSSKITTYAAAGVPVIIDGPEEAASWRLVDRYGAGILCGGDEEESLRRLSSLFGEEESRRRMAEGSARLCREALDLDANIERFRDTLSRAARGAGG
jgi:hypothetical protein